jgi:hypothetical protein
MELIKKAMWVFTRHSPSLICIASCRISIVARHSLRNLHCATAEILFVDAAASSQDDRHRAQSAVLGRVRKKCKAARHLPVYDVALSTVGGAASKLPRVTDLAIFFGRHWVISLLPSKTYARFEEQGP